MLKLDYSVRYPIKGGYSFIVEKVQASTQKNKKPVYFEDKVQLVKMDHTGINDSIHDIFEGSRGDVANKIEREYGIMCSLPPTNECIELSDKTVVKHVLQYITDCDTDKLARICGECFGGSCTNEGDSDVYQFYPNEKYVGEFDLSK